MTAIRERIKHIQAIARFKEPEVYQRLIEELLASDHQNPGSGRILANLMEPG